MRDSYINKQFSHGIDVTYKWYQIKFTLHKHSNAFWFSSGVVLPLKHDIPYVERKHIKIMFVFLSMSNVRIELTL